MNTYFILLRQSRGGRDAVCFPLDEARCAHLRRLSGVQLFDVYTVSGHFDLMLICRAENNDPIRRLLKELNGWETTSMLASRHVGRFWTGDDVSSTTWLGTTYARETVRAGDPIQAPTFTVKKSP